MCSATKRSRRSSEGAGTSVLAPESDWKAPTPQGGLPMAVTIVADVAVAIGCLELTPGLRNARATASALTFSGIVANISEEDVLNWIRNMGPMSGNYSMQVWEEFRIIVEKQGRPSSEDYYWLWHSGDKPRWNEGFKVYQELSIIVAQSSSAFEDQVANLDRRPFVEVDDYAMFFIC